MTPIVAVLPILAAIVAAYYGVRWSIRWAKSRERLVVARVVSGSSSLLLLPDLTQTARNTMVVDVGGEVQEWSVMPRELIQKAKPGQLARFTIIGGLVIAMEVLEPATPEHEGRARQLLQQWRAGPRR